MAENEEQKPEKKFGGFFRKQDEEDTGKSGMDKKASQHRITPFRTTPSPFGGSCPVSYEEEEEEDEKKE